MRVFLIKVLTSPKMTSIENWGCFKANCSYNNNGRKWAVNLNFEPFEKRSNQWQYISTFLYYQKH